MPITWSLKKMCSTTIALLSPVCERGLGECPAQARASQSAACGRLAAVALADGDVETARGLVATVLSRCDTEHELCEPVELLPAEVLDAESWEARCADGDGLACRLAEAWRY